MFLNSLTTNFPLLSLPILAIGGLVWPFGALLLCVPLVLFLGHVDFGPYSAWNYLFITAAFAVVLRLALGKRLLIGKQARPFLILSLLFFVWFQVLHALWGNSLQAIAFANLKLFSAVGVGVLTAWANQTKSRLKWYVRIFCFSVFITALVALFQAYGFDFAWDLRAITGLDPADPISAQIVKRQRISGLAYFNVTLCYHLAAFTPVLLGLALSHSTLSVKRFLWLGAFSICLWTSFISESESAILAVAFGTAVILYAHGIGSWRVKINPTYRPWIKAFILVSALSALSVSIWKIDISNSSRFPQWLAGLSVFWDNPWGIANGNYIHYVSSHFEKFSDWPGAYFILRTIPHNQFVNTLVMFGLPGLFLLLGIYFFAARALFRVCKRPATADLRYLALGLLGGLAGYVVQSFFHNAGPFLRDVVHWQMLGAIFALSSLNQRALHDLMKGVTQDG